MAFCLPLSLMLEVGSFSCRRKPAAVVAVNIWLNWKQNWHHIPQWKNSISPLSPLLTGRRCQFLTQSPQSVFYREPENLGWRKRPKARGGISAEVTGRRCCQRSSRGSSERLAGFGRDDGRPGLFLSRWLIFNHYICWNKYLFALRNKALWVLPVLMCLYLIFGCLSP